MKLSDNITLEEVVGSDIYRERGNAAAQLIDMRIINVAQHIRDLIGRPLIINNWLAGGKYQERGFRNSMTTTGVKYSQHKYGRALDFHIEGYTSDQVRKIIRDNWPALKEHGLTTIELGTQGWVHIDCRYTGLSYLLEVPFK